MGWGVRGCVGSSNAAIRTAQTAKHKISWRLDPFFPFFLFLSFFLWVMAVLFFNIFFINFFF